MVPKLMGNRAGLGSECAKLLERLFSKLINMLFEAYPRRRMMPQGFSYAIS